MINLFKIQKEFSDNDKIKILFNTVVLWLDDQKILKGMGMLII